MVSHGFSKLKLLHSYSLGDCLADKRELYSGILASAHSSLSSSKKLGIISSIFSYYNDIKPKKSITGRKLKKKKQQIPEQAKNQRETKANRNLETDENGNKIWQALPDRARKMPRKSL